MESFIKEIKKRHPFVLSIHFEDGPTTYLVSFRYSPLRGIRDVEVCKGSVDSMLISKIDYEKKSAGQSIFERMNWYAQRVMFLAGASLRRFIRRHFPNG